MNKLMPFIIIGVLLIANYALAETIPAFPMAFWGNVTINGDAAPVNTIIRAYYDAVFAGQAVVKETGIYGYDSSIGQKLLVGEGEGIITFTFQSSGFNGGQETNGTSLQSHSSFVSGETIHKDLSFSVEIPVSAPPSSGGGGGGGGDSGGSSGGGGGGGGGGSYTPPLAPIKGDINNDKKVDKYDFSLMMANWGKTGSNDSDLNNDQKIDKYDFALLMLNWSK